MEAFFPIITLVFAVVTLWLIRLLRASQRNFDEAVQAARGAQEGWERALQGLKKAQEGWSEALQTIRRLELQLQHNGRFNIPRV